MESPDGVIDPVQATELLLAAARAGDTVRVRDLVRHDASSAMRALIAAAVAGQAETAAVIAELPDASPGLSPALLLAARHGHPTVVDVLLAAGAENIDQALVEAAAHDVAEAVIRLLPVGSTGAADAALEIAAERGHTALVSLLIEAGATSLGQALKCAIDGGHIRVCEQLLDAGANPSEGLCDAALVGNAALSQLFIRRGAQSLDQAFLIASKAGKTDALVEIVHGRAPDQSLTKPSAATAAAAPDPKACAGKPQVVAAAAERAQQRVQEATAARRLDRGGGSTVKKPVFQRAVRSERRA
mmetsp:Transcript_8695/g.22501  ORF Transcript_8695/g.22501 Transcript_8695/m.22501 type:complete len:301 (-) Transcript_8695:235-1137(-)